MSISMKASCILYVLLTRNLLRTITILVDKLSLTAYTQDSRLSQALVLGSRQNAVCATRQANALTCKLQRLRLLQLNMPLRGCVAV